SALIARSLRLANGFFISLAYVASVTLAWLLPGRYRWLQSMHKLLPSSQRATQPRSSRNRRSIGVF
ncbi:MAG: hypothetical protein ABIP44_09915, partial [Pseudoxanthomonas sp.]